MLILKSDIETQLNKNLTSNGQALADALIPSVQKWAEGRCGYPFEATATTEYFSNGGYSFQLHTFAPVTVGPTVTVYDTVADDYTAYTDTVRLLSTNQVRLKSYAFCYPDGVAISYTAGWDSSTSPEDLKQALIDLVAQKMIDSENPGQKLTRVTSGQYTEEYALSRGTADYLNDVPANVLEVVDGYAFPIVI